MRAPVDENADAFFDRRPVEPAFTEICNQMLPELPGYSLNRTGDCGLVDAQKRSNVAELLFFFEAPEKNHSVPHGETGASAAEGIANGTFVTADGDIRIEAGDG